MEITKYNGKYKISIGNGKPVTTRKLVEVLECVCHYFDYDHHVPKSGCPFCERKPES